MTHVFLASSPLPEPCLLSRYSSPIAHALHSRHRSLQLLERHGPCCAPEHLHVHMQSGYLHQKPLQSAAEPASTAAMAQQGSLACFMRLSTAASGEGSQVDAGCCHSVRVNGCEIEMPSGRRESVVEGQLKFRSRLVRVPISQHSLSAYHDPSLQAPIAPKLVAL